MDNLRQEYIQGILDFAAGKITKEEMDRLDGRIYARMVSENDQLWSQLKAVDPLFFTEALKTAEKEMMDANAEGDTGLRRLKAIIYFSVRVAMAESFIRLFNEMKEDEDNKEKESD